MLGASGNRNENLGSREFPNLVHKIMYISKVFAFAWISWYSKDVGACLLECTFLDWQIDTKKGFVMTLVQNTLLKFFLLLICGPMHEAFWIFRLLAGFGTFGLAVAAFVLLAGARWSAFLST